MSDETGASSAGLDVCGCCEGLTASTPLEVYNRPGLAAIAYRVGTHAEFKRSMLARLSSSDLPALRGLNTRDDDDFAVALLDGWAMVADVLTFYQERIANESYLRTATERGSLLELARLIGYEPRPGVAASAYLAFKLEEAPGSPRTATVEAGTKVQSLPGQNELPQTFETEQEIQARVEWNELHPRRTNPQSPAVGDQHAYLQGVTTNLSPGDPLLILGPQRESGPGSSQSDQWEVRRVISVEPDIEAARTLVRWDEPLGGTILPAASMAGGAKVFALRLRASLFGNNAPQREALPESLIGEPNGIYRTGQPYADSYLPASSREINLDAVFPQIIPGSWIVIVRPPLPPQPTATTATTTPTPAEVEHLYRVEDTLEETKAAYTIVAKSTRLGLSGKDFDGFSPRTVTVHALSEELPLAEYPIDADVAGDEVTLDRAVEGLEKGRLVLVSGTTTEGRRAVEAMVLADAFPSTDGLTVLRFEGELANEYLLDSVTITANVASATHGERREEVLGNGDAGVAYQRFTLRESPLTYVRSTTPGGTESTLQVRVNDVLWREVTSLYGRGPNERVYTTLRDDEGKTTVQFGDGRTGARPPTGQENVRAVYRKGIGLEGKVRADQLSLLLTRPLGVRSVANPEAATDAADPEPREEVRQNAPLTVLTLDRVVSLRDHEDFARAYAGISKALANWVWDGERRGAFVTVAGPGGSVPSGDLVADLLSAMREAGEPYHPLFVEPFRPVLFHVAASVKVDADFLPERVLTAVEATLRERFSFEARSFGQSVALSEIAAVAQGVPGVVAVDIDSFYRECKEAGDTAVLKSQCVPGESNARLDARGPQVGVGGAELLTLNPAPLSLRVML